MQFCLLYSLDGCIISRKSIHGGERARERKIYGDTIYRRICQLGVNLGQSNLKRLGKLDIWPTYKYIILYTYILIWCLFAHRTLPSAGVFCVTYMIKIQNICKVCV